MAEPLPMEAMVEILHSEFIRPIMAMVVNLHQAVLEVPPVLEVSTWLAVLAVTHTLATGPWEEADSMEVLVNKEHLLQQIQVLVAEAILEGVAVEVPEVTANFKSILQ